MRIKVATIMLFVFLFATSVFASDTEYYIRVGLENKFFDFDDLDIETENITVGYKLEGDEKGVLAPSTRGANFSNLSKAKIAKDNRFYIILNGSYEDFNSAEIEALNLRNQGLPVYSAIANATTYALAVGPYEDEETSLIELDKLKGFNLNGQIYSDKNVFTLSDDGEIKLVFLSKTFDPQVRALNNMPITIGYEYYKESLDDSQIMERVFAKATYRGIIELNRNTTNRLRAINIVMLEEYLYSVVPSEMPSSWEIEALKAQSVAARNYVITNKSHVDDGYDVCDTIHSQVYRGYVSESERTTNAVNSTRGQIAYHDHKPINAYFFSSSGGHTADSENVWVAEVPYLRGVDDSYDTTGKVWTRSFTQSDLTLGAKEAGYSVGTIVGAEITKEDEFGRVIALTFLGTRGSFTIEKDAIRAFFTHVNYPLESTNFKITRDIGDVNVMPSGNTVYLMNAYRQKTEMDFDNVYIKSYQEEIKFSKDEIVVLGANGNIKLIEEETFIIDNSNYIDENDNTINQHDGILELSGKGWGHGIGLSQHGANGMAKEGYTFDQILKHYYTDITIE